jgi:hypothetical protein
MTTHAQGRQMLSALMFWTHLHCMRHACIRTGGSQSLCQ